MRFTLLLRISDLISMIILLDNFAIRVIYNNFVALMVFSIEAKRELGENPKQCPLL
jgi:hypothetical protein